MEDERIIELYWRRDERAIAETDGKYGAYCRAVSMNILGVREDAEECVNDTYVHAWNAMPPQRPTHLRLWLAKLTRGNSFNLWNKNHAQKRGGGNMCMLLSELDECVPAPRGVEEIIEARELGRAINAWLAKLSDADRVIFMRRYWCAEGTDSIAESYGVSANTLTKRLSRMRASLKRHLEMEGITV